MLLGCGMLRGKGSGAPAPGRCVVARFALSFSMTLVLANSLGWHGCSLRSVPTPCSFDRNVSAALRSLVGWIIPVKQPGFKTDGSGVDWRRGRQPAEVLVGRALSGLLRARQPVGAGGDRGLPQQQQRIAFSQKNPHSNCSKRAPNRPLRPRGGRFGTLLELLQCGIFGRTAVWQAQRAAERGRRAQALDRILTHCLNGSGQSPAS